MRNHLLHSAMFVLICTIVAGCNEGSYLPTAPEQPTSKPPTASNEVWMMGVVSSYRGECLAGAQVTVVQGKNAGFQAANDCTSSSYGYRLGYRITGLRDDDDITLRISCEGFAPLERRLIVRGNPGDSVHRADFYLEDTK